MDDQQVSSMDSEPNTQQQFAICAGRILPEEEDDFLPFRPPNVPPTETMSQQHAKTHPTEQIWIAARKALHSSYLDTEELAHLYTQNEKNIIRLNEEIKQLDGNAEVTDPPAFMDNTPTQQSMEAINWHPTNQKEKAELIATTTSFMKQLKNCAAKLLDEIAIQNKLLQQQSATIHQLKAANVECNDPMTDDERPFQKLNDLLILSDPQPCGLQAQRVQTQVRDNDYYFGGTPVEVEIVSESYEDKESTPIPNPVHDWMLSPESSNDELENLEAAPGIISPSKRIVVLHNTQIRPADVHLAESLSSDDEPNTQLQYEICAGRKWPIEDDDSPEPMLRQTNNIVADDETGNNIYSTTYDIALPGNVQICPPHDHAPPTNPISNICETIAGDATVVGSEVLEVPAAHQHAEVEVSNYNKRTRNVLLDSSSGDEDTLIVPQPTAKDAFLAPPTSNDGWNRGGVIAGDATGVGSPECGLGAASNTSNIENVLNWNDEIGSLLNKGLININRTCYANSILQALFHIPEVIQWSKILPDFLKQLKMDTEKTQLSSALAALFEFMRSTNQLIRPVTFITTFIGKAPDFPLGIEHDAHEFFKTLCNIIGNELGETQFGQIFAMTSNEQNVCLQHRHKYTKEVTLGGLELPLTTSQSTFINVTTLLEDYFRSETIRNEDNLYQCDGCQSKVHFERYQKITSAPIYLMLTLKRFIFELTDPQGNKIQQTSKNHLKVNIEEFLELQPFMDNHQSNTYELQSIVLHIGNDCHSGHYVTIVRDHHNNWTKYNDAQVSNFDFATMDMSQPYMLFYRRLSPIQPELLLSSEANQINGFMDTHQQSHPATFDNPGNPPDTSTSTSSTRPKRNLPQTSYRQDSELDDEFEDFSPDEEEYRPPNNVSCSSDASDLDDNDSTPFRRNNRKRITPINTKKHIRTSAASTPLPEDLLADLSITKLRHKTPTPQAINGVAVSSYNARNFNDSEELYLSALVADARKGRNKMKSNSHQEIAEKASTEFKRKVTATAITNYLKNAKRSSGRVGNRAPPLAPQMKMDLLEFYNKSNNWTNIMNWMRQKYPNMTSKLQTLKQIVTNTKKVPFKKCGKWTDDEVNLLMAEIAIHGMRPSKCNVPNRDPPQIATKLQKINNATIRAQGCKSFPKMLLEAFDMAADKDGVVRQSDWKQKLFETNPHIPTGMLEYSFANVLANLRAYQAILEISSGLYKKAPKIVRPTLPPLKQAPRDKFRDLTPEEKQHVTSEIHRCRQESQKKNKLEWYGNKMLNLLATTTEETRREITIEVHNNLFQDVALQNEFENWLYGDEINDNEIDDDDLNDDQDFVLESEQRKRTLQVLGVIRFLNSEKVLFFFTGTYNFYDYIHKQLQSTHVSRGCPSWFAAFVIEKRQIDYNKCTFLITADTTKTAMRTKLTTVNMCKTPCFNVRQITLAPLVNGRDLYLNVLQDSNILTKND